MPAAPSSLIDPAIGQLLLPVAQALDGEPTACCRCWPRSRTLARRHSSDNGPLSLAQAIAFVPLSPDALIQAGLGWRVPAYYLVRGHTKGV
jgi:hypothetical protein